MTYSDQRAWRRIQAFLPASHQLSGDALPVEEWWSWEGHRVHLDVFRVPDAAAKVILFHGVGTNGRQMSTVLGAPLSRCGLEVIAIDLPGYGVTEVRRGARVLYDDWVRAGSALVAAELERDPRPVYVYGLSAGGMLAYHVAAEIGRVRGIVGMTFLDQREDRVRRATALHPWLAALGAPMIAAAAETRLAHVRVPMWLASKMYALVNDPHALAGCLGDKTSAGNWVTLAFLNSYLSFAPAVEPEDFDVCPTLLTQPTRDRWTGLGLSEPFLARMG